MTGSKARTTVALDKGRKSIQDRIARGLPGFKTPIEKASEHPKSLRLAINAKCFDCVGAGADTNPRQMIGQCRIQHCPLWPVRPYQHHG